MAVYTIELGTLVKSNYHLALDSYPIYDEQHRQKLNEKIIRHYWFREIGMETPDRFNMYLEERMNEIMPYYNELYRTVAIEYNPLVTDFIESETDSASTIGRQSGHQSVRNDGERVQEAGTRYTDTKGTKDFTHGHTEDRTAGYGKSGDHTIDDTSKEVQDLDMDSTYHNTEKTDITDDTTGEHNLKESGDKDTTGKKVDESKTVLHTDTTNETTSTLNRVENYSDFPQTAIEVTTTTAPDGTVTTTSKGYLTTQTQINQTETSKSKGTVDTTTDYNNTTDTTGHEDTSHTLGEDTTQQNVRDGTVTDDSNAHESNDNTFDKTAKQVKQWREGGSDTYHLGNDAEEHTDTTGIEKDNTQRTNARSQTSLLTASDSMQQGNNLKLNRREIGRRGRSAAQLLREYRANILNIDVQIINELQDLFMEVY